MPMEPENAGQKQAAGRFQKGQSGNPQGKPPGTRHRATRAAMALLEGESEALTRKAVELALEGDVTALRLCLERICPPMRERPIAVHLPAVADASGLPLLTGRILAAVGTGDLTPSEGAKIADLVVAHGRVLELHELEQRIRVLEADRENDD